MEEIKIKGKMILLATVLIIGISITTSKVEAATNNSMQTAQSISMNNLYSGSITNSVDARFYKFTLNESGRITINYKAFMPCSTYVIYNSNGEELDGSYSNYWNDTTELYSSNDKYDLTKGIYYFCVEKYAGKTGNFNFTMNFAPSGESFSEGNGRTNNLMSSANNIDLGKLYKGQIASNDDKDFYKVSLQKDCKLKLVYEAHIACSTYYIFDNNGRKIEESYSNYWNDTSESFISTKYIDLDRGTYYFCVEKYAGKTGNYCFTLSQSVAFIKLNKNSLILEKNKTSTLKATLTPYTNEKITWKSQYKDIATVNSKGVVTGKKAGYTTITATVGDRLKAKCIVYVKPDATKLKKVKSGKKYSKKCYVYLKWESKKNIDGYQVYYAKSKKGKFKKLYTTYGTSASISLERKKTYYFIVRTYKYANGKNVYSSWSNVKSIYLK